VSPSIRTTLIVAAPAAVAVLRLLGPARVRSYNGSCDTGGVGKNVDDNVASLGNRGRYMTILACVDSWRRGGCIRAYPGEASGDLGPYANRLSFHGWVLG
jgi:hypothetical protein